ncbi:aldolase [Alicyclobacillus hesperidum subsp. aegles]|uniref:class II aldolase/adducin family protein n=1 Tax=Alicyclobacillus hesperidum TaxID=89784 RepID=UPI00222AFE7A|nr:class II aldolase/adducin family protein [Alicyclobacillus hesperidum]GLG02811.1 aldolase [Alicyclobacillus hesperidum subsp. aegles]
MGIGICDQLTSYAQEIVRKGLVVGPGGNISARDGDVMYISPSGVDIGGIRPEEWVQVELPSGKVISYGARPSSEILMHLECYLANPNINAVIHTHPTFCIALSCITNELPTLFPDQAALVGKVGFLPYMLPTTQGLAQMVKDMIQSFNAIILVNHGLVTVGRTLREAYYRTQIVEESSKIYLTASAITTPRILTEEQVKEIQLLEAETYRVQLLGDN